MAAKIDPDDLPKKEPEASQTEILAFYAVIQRDILPLVAEINQRVQQMANRNLFMRGARLQFSIQFKNSLTFSLSGSLILSPDSLVEVDRSYSAESFSEIQNDLQTILSVLEAVNQPGGLPNVRRVRNS